MDGFPKILFSKNSKLYREKFKIFLKYLKMDNRTLHHPIYWKPLNHKEMKNKNSLIVDLILIMADSKNWSNWGTFMNYVASKYLNL